MSVFLSAEDMHSNDFFLAVVTLENGCSTHPISGIHFILQHVSLLTNRTGQLTHAHLLTIPRESYDFDAFLPDGFAGEVNTNASELFFQISSLQLNDCKIQHNQLI